MQHYDEKREIIIKRSRDVQKLAKQAIYSLHRGQPEQAQGKIDTAERTAKELLPLIEQHSSLRPGSYSASMEEVVQLIAGALIQNHCCRYLGGVLDFAGELNRFAVARATVRDMEAVQQCRDLVDGLMGQFLQFDIRNGSLRKKFDSLKYTLRKLENTLYELSL
eukprot:jgi/Astpho2/17/gw1.00001.52.1_t